MEIEDAQRNRDEIFRALREGKSIDEIAAVVLEPVPKVGAEGKCPTEKETETKPVLSYPPSLCGLSCLDGHDAQALRTVHGEVIECCGGCGGFNVIFEHGFVHCRDCDHCETSAAFDWEYDYRTFADNKGDTSRCMAPRAKLTAPHLMITGNGRSALERMHRTYCSTYHEKTLDAMCRHLESMAKGASIPQRVIDQAFGYAYQIFKKDSGGTLFRGGNRNGLMAACLYNAMKHFQGFFPNVDEFAGICKVESRFLSRGIHEFPKILESAASVTQFYEHKPETFIKPWVSKLVFENAKLHKARPEIFDERFIKNLSDKVIQYLEKLERCNFPNKPETLAAGCLWWLLTQIPDMLKMTGLTREDLAPICHVSESTIGQMAKEIGHIFVVDK